MKYQDLERWVSKPRLERYLLACGNSKVRAKKMYRANLLISQSYYPVLNLFEVIFRNLIHEQLSTFFADPNWIVTQKTGFMSDPSLKPSKFYLKYQVNKAEKKIKRNKSPFSTGKIIAEQSLGFWTSLFEPHHYALLGGSLIHCFPHKPAPVNRSAILVKLKRIKDFRNRVYHNEPICFLQNNIDFQNAETIKTDIYDLLSWCDAGIVDYTQKLDFIDIQIERAKRI